MTEEQTTNLKAAPEERDAMRRRFSMDRIRQFPLPHVTSNVINESTNGHPTVAGEIDVMNIPGDQGKMQRRFSLERISSVNLPTNDSNAIKPKTSQLVTNIMLEAMLCESEPKRSRRTRRSTMDLLGPIVKQESLRRHKATRRLSLDNMIGTYSGDRKMTTEFGVLDAEKRDSDSLTTEDISNPGYINENDDVNENAVRQEYQNSFESDLYPNCPHPTIEFPPLYFVLKRFPFILNKLECLYKFRWELQYPLQRRIPLSKKLRKIGITATWGECLLMLPFIIIFVQGLMTSFVHPSVSKSGVVSRLPLIICFLTASHNSLITLLLGIPFERAIKYHKISGYLAFLNGIFHTYVAWVSHEQNIDGDKEIPNFFSGTTVNMSGTLLLCIILSMIITTSPYIRRKTFEVFYYFHIIFAMTMMGCAFYHSGVLVPILASTLWGGDIIMRKLYMACFRYPRTAQISQLTDTVVELRIPKIAGFDYNPGQVKNFSHDFHNSVHFSIFIITKLTSYYHLIPTVREDSSTKN